MAAAPIPQTKVRSPSPPEVPLTDIEMKPFDAVAQGSTEPKTRSTPVPMTMPGSSLIDPSERSERLLLLDCPWEAGGRDPDGVSH
jgi:hypothetical protein